MESYVSTFEERKMSFINVSEVSQGFKKTSKIKLCKVFKSKLKAFIPMIKKVVHDEVKEAVQDGLL